MEPGDRAPRHRSVRLRVWLRQRCPHRLFPVVEQRLQPSDARPLFHLRHLLCARNDAGLGARYAHLEPAPPCDRLVPRRIFPELSAALARPVLSGRPRDPGAVWRARTGTRAAAQAECAPVITLDRVAKAYPTTGGRKIVLED